MKKLRKVLFIIFLLFLMIGRVEATNISGPRQDSEGNTTWDIITFGKYKLFWNDDALDHPLEWRVLQVSGNNALVIAEELLVDEMPYHKTFENITWSNSDLRAWLNGTRTVSYDSEYIPTSFYDAAFTDEEKKLIQNTTVTGDGYSVVDKIFILSSDELCNKNYGFNEEYSVVSLSRMAKFYGKNYNRDYIGYWTRDGMNGYDSKKDAYKYYVSHAGEITENYPLRVDTDNYKVNYIPASVHVRPVMWINYKSNKVAYKGTVTDIGDYMGDGEKDIKYQYVTALPMASVPKSEVTYKTYGSKNIIYDPVKNDMVRYSFNYNGIELLKDRDYTVILDNYKVGKVNVTYTLKGVYSGTFTDTFNLQASSISSGTWIKEIDTSNKKYTGKEIKPSVKFKYNRLYLKDTDPDYYLVEGRDYKVTYTDNINKGIGVITIEGINNFNGTLRYYFNIVDTAPGDVDGDGDIDLTDILMILKAFFNNASILNNPQYDINNDGKLDLSDILTVLKYFFNKQS